MTVYVFDKGKTLRTPLSTAQITDLIHDENNYSLTAAISSDVTLQTGEYIGFTCADGMFRLFEISKAAHDDDRNVTDVTASDAIVAEAKEAIIEGEVQQLDVKLTAALQTLAPDWEVEGEEPDRVEKSRAYFSSLWTMIETFRTLYEWRIVPYYRFDGGKITARVLHLEKDEATFRGRILTSRKDASKVYLTRTGRPITRLYGLGPATGSGDVTTYLTFADAVWSVDNGDPVDKPKGQTWVEDPEAVAEDGVHTDTVSITDAEDAEDLLQKTWDALQEKKTPAVNIQATVADMEMVPGYEHQQIRLGDLVAVRLRTGETVEARVIAIKRNYIRPWLTTITIGNKTDTITTQVSSLITSATHTFERLTIYKNRFHEDEALIQLNAEHIQLNATTIIEHAEQILLKADKEELDSVYVLIDAINQDIVLQAEKIQANADSITLQAGEIDLKADKTYVDNLVAQYATIDYLESNYVTTEDFNAVTSWTESFASDSIETNYFYAGDAHVGALTVSGESLNSSTLTMGPTSATMFAPSDINLAHSHAVTVDGGVVTLGEVSSSGGSFNIADTQFYIDGVSASYNKGMLENKPSNLSVTGAINGTNEYLLSVALTNVYGNEIITFTGVTFDAREAYDNGYDDGYAAGYQAAKDAVEVTGGIRSITNTAANYMYAEGWASAKIDGEEVDYTTFSGSQYFPGLGQ